MSLSALARLLGIKPDLAEDALHSERAARAVLTRRNLFAAGGALAAGSVFSFGSPALEFPSGISLAGVPLRPGDTWIISGQPGGLNGVYVVSARGTWTRRRDFA